MAWPKRILLVAGVLLAGALLYSQAVLLPTGWRITAAGTQTPVDNFPMSVARPPDSKHLLVLQAGQKPAISAIDTATGRVTSTVSAPDAWLGLAFAPRGDRVYTGGGARSAIFEFTFSNGVLAPARTFEVSASAARGPQDFIGDVALSPDGRMLYAAELFRNSIAIINPQSGMTINRIKTGRRPYRILFHPDGKSFFVSHWADGSVGHYDTDTGSALTTIRIGAHPTDLLWRNGGPADPVPGEPTWVARLFVTAANTNSVFTVAVSEAKDLKQIDTINVAMTPHQPLGMTPSALALSADESRVFVACSDANAVAVVNVTGERGYVEGFIPAGAYPIAMRALPSGKLAVLNAQGNPGSVSWIDPFTPQQLEAWTKAVEANAAYRDAKILETVSLPAIQHIIYVLREGSGTAPNLAKLSREFTRLDNFQAIGDTAAERYAWSTAAIASDHVRKLAARGVIDPEPQNPAALPPAGYLWTNAAMAGLSIRNFGFMTRDPVLARVTSPGFRGTDAERAKAFVAEMETFEKSGTMPRLTLIRITDGDAVLGAIVEAISKSRFWTSAAVFVVPGSGDGRALLISPFGKRRGADSTKYSVLSVLRTIELLLGLRPMTHFDGGAPPMTAAFQEQPDPAPYSAVAK